MAEKMPLSETKCKICSADAFLFFSAKLLQRYEVKYFSCCECGFVQTEEPYWLEEAYSDAITGSDIGLVDRNFKLARITMSVIRTCFNSSVKFLDYAGGYGLMVRLMRDSGFNFQWYDKYCDNLFAQGFEATSGDSKAYDLVTAFEVMEHMRNPLEDIKELLTYSRNILFTTNILQLTHPKPESWWYYGLDHGQHISFFTIESLKFMARKHSLNFYTNGKSVHLFTEKRIPPGLFRVATLYSFASLLCVASHRKSLLMSDYTAMYRIH